MSLVRVGIVKITKVHRLSSHFFETECLGTDLQLIIVKLSPVSALVFHGIPTTIVLFD